ncbi:MAG: MBL fold metallo-hydrolase [Pseudomonadota bacterium]
MSEPTIQTFFHEATYTCSYLVSDPDSGVAAIVDPALDYNAASGRTGTTQPDAMLAAIHDNELDVDWILETHAHADHLSAAAYLKSRLPDARVGIGRGIRAVQETFRAIFNLDDLATDGRQFDALFDDGEQLSLGGVHGEVMATPGHTSDSVSYRFASAVFVGDTLFAPDYGTARVDFPGGDAATLYASIRRLLALPDDTRLYLCHDYMPGGRALEVCHTVAEQRRKNVHVGGDMSAAAFTAMRLERDATLAMPALIIPSVQVNIRAGDWPPAESNGVHYLKVPLNRFGSSS